MMKEALDPRTADLAELEDQIAELEGRVYSGNYYPGEERLLDDLHAEREELLDQLAASEVTTETLGMRTSPLLGTDGSPLRDYDPGVDTEDALVQLWHNLSDGADDNRVQNALIDAGVPPYTVSGVRAKVTGGI